jgi:hypothetical protein
VRQVEQFDDLGAVFDRIESFTQVLQIVFGMPNQFDIVRVIDH